MRDGAKKNLILLTLVLLSIATLSVCPLIGFKDIPAKVIFVKDYSSLDYSIYWNMRLPRALVGFMVGAMLSICGMAFQALFRNPLTTPFTLGVSSGAAFGAVAFIILGSANALFLGINISLGAFIGAMVSIALLYFLANLRKNFSTLSMLLAGVAINFFFSSLILFMQYMADFTKVFQTYRWLIGSIDAFGYQKVVVILPFFIFGFVSIMILSNELNLILLGEDIAVSKGLDIKRFKIAILLICSIMVGGAVSLCGVIGFVGMVIPHICRMIIGQNHKYLIPASLLSGGVFLTICDAISRKIIAPAELPVGIITALLGGPFFVWLLLSRNPKHSI